MARTMHMKVDITTTIHSGTSFSAIFSSPCEYAFLMFFSSPSFSTTYTSNSPALFSYFALLLPEKSPALLSISSLCMVQLMRSPPQVYISHSLALIR